MKQGIFDSFESLKGTVSNFIKDIFPVKGSVHSLYLKRLDIADHGRLDDFSSQSESIVKGKTYQIPVKASMELTDTETRKVIDRKTMTLLSIPRITYFGTYIVNGTQYSFPYQLRLKAGVYTHIHEDGALKSQFNLSKGRNFHIELNKNGVFLMNIGASKLKLYPLLLSLGITNAQFEKVWGKEVVGFNRRYAKDVHKVVEALHKKLFFDEAPESFEEGVKNIKLYLKDGTELDPKVTKLTLGVASDRVTPEIILETTVKLLGVSRGDRSEDDRDSLIYKSILDISDFAEERFKNRKFKSRIERMFKNNVDKFDTIDKIVYKDVFQKPMTTLFTETVLARTPKQNNPMDMFSNFSGVTFTGEGGITSEHQLSAKARAVSPSHLGFVDPVFTPEGSNVGISLHLSMGADKKGRDLYTNFIDVKTGKAKSLQPIDVWNSYIAFPEDYIKGKLKPGKIRMMYQGQTVTVSSIKANYVVPTSNTLFDIPTVAVPFLSNNNGSRAMIAATMTTQAKPLKYREEPLIQSRLTDEQTVEDAIGSSFCAKATVNGTIKSITKKQIVITDSKGKNHSIEIVNDYLLNEHNYLESDVLVKVGDKVKAGETIADTNYTRGGKLAIGVNLVTAYTPYKGLNFEDGIVISEKASDKLTSMHSYQNTSGVDSDTVLDLKKYRSYFPTNLTNDQALKMDERGIIKVGEEVVRGDYLIAKMRRVEAIPESKRLAQISRVLKSDFMETSLVWQKDVPGIISAAQLRAKNVLVVVKTEEKAKIGDKIVGRYGNKGVIVDIMPNEKSPTNEKGESVDVLLNPHGVTSRMNIGQIYEMAASKIAEADGKPYIAKQMEKNQGEAIKAELKRRKIKDHETIFDPDENKHVEGINVGKQYFLKLEHLASKKISARGAGATENYTSENQPSRGKGKGGRAIGLMEMYSLLAHGASKNLKEMYTLKSDYDPEVWRAIENGQPVPMPQSTYSTDKFAAMLKGMGVNLTKKGDEMHMTPFLDKDIKEISNGEIKKSLIIRAKDLKEEAGGLFDIDKTGGMTGSKWTHIKLNSPIPNPTFEKAIVSLCRIKVYEFKEIVDGKLFINKSREISTSTQKGYKTGPDAIKMILEAIDMSARIRELKRIIVGKTGTELNVMNRELRFLLTLKSNNLKPVDYLIKNIPVLPPKFRPIYALPDGNLRVADINEHYKTVMQVNSQVKGLDRPEFKEEKNALVGQLYKAVQGAVGFDKGIVQNDMVKGLAETISGPSPKLGYYQSSLLKKRQDISGTSVIVNGPELGIDEVGIPDFMAWKTFKPFIIKELKSLGMSKLRAMEEIEDKTTIAKQALINVMDKKKVILNRAPTLHKFSTMAFKPQLVPGYAIRMPSLPMGGFNADIDGDTLGVHVPISAEADEEAEEMMPSKHLFKPGSGQLMLQLTHEYVLGLYRLSKPGRPVNKRFSSTKDVIKAFNDGKLKYNNKVSVSSIGVVTPGQVLINHKLPKQIQDYKSLFDKTKIRSTLLAAQAINEQTFTSVIHHLKDLGRKYAFLTGSSLLLSDLQQFGDKNKIMARADADASFKNDTGKIKIYHAADQKILELSNKAMKNNSAGLSNNLSDMINSGSRGSKSTIKNITGAVGQMIDHDNRVMTDPVRSNYTEGLGTLEYFNHMYGNRKSMVSVYEATKDPGALTKEMMVTASTHKVVEHDCGTTDGIYEPIDKHILDRVSAENVPGCIKKNEVIGNVQFQSLRKRKLNRLKVRSSMKCLSQHGVCVLCYGLDETGQFPDIGDNIGIKETQGLTEPSTQLALASKHQGGAAPSSGMQGASGFKRIKQLFDMPQNLPGAAILSTMNGTVSRITESPLGGKDIFIDEQKFHVPINKAILVKVGGKVTKGDKLSEGAIQYQQYVGLRGLGETQKHLRDDIYDAYSNGGVFLKKKSIETTVRMLTDHVRVLDPGDHGGFIVGDYSTMQIVDNWNKTRLGKKPIMYEHVLPGANVLPHKGTDWARRMALSHLKDTMQLGAASGFKTSLTGTGSPYGKLIFGK